MKTWASVLTFSVGTNKNDSEYVVLDVLVVCHEIRALKFKAFVSLVCILFIISDERLSKSHSFPVERSKGAAWSYVICGIFKPELSFGCIEIWTFVTRLNATPRMDGCYGNSFMIIANFHLGW